MQYANMMYSIMAIIITTHIDMAGYSHPIELYNTVITVEY